MRIETGVPILIGADGIPIGRWSRVGLSDHRIDEDWLQALVFSNPETLPVSYIDPAFAPLIPIGREVPTEAGPMDALYLSPDGALTILEAKLWRNPQARREVIGQIIDYATAVAAWSFDDLNSQAVSIAGSTLWQLVQGVTSFDEEHRFNDAVIRNLRKGRFLLLVVGDGIREEIERMAKYVQSAPQLQFSMALVEFQIYENAEKSERLAIPSVVARTEEIPRAVIDVQLAEAAQVSVHVSVPDASEPAASRGTLTTEQILEAIAASTSDELAEFAGIVRSDFEEDLRFYVENKSASFVVKLREPGGGGPLTILVVNRAGNVHPGWLGQQLPSAGISEELGYGLVADLAEIMSADVKGDDPQWWVAARPLAVLRDSYPQVKNRILEFADEVYDLS